MSEIGAFVGQFVEDGVGDEFDGELDVAEGGTETNADKGEEGFQGADVEAGDFWSERDVFPKFGVVGDHSPFLADSCHAANLAVADVAEDV